MIMGLGGSGSLSRGTVVRAATAIMAMASREASDPAATAITATASDGASDATTIMAMASGGASDPAVPIATTDVASVAASVAALAATSAEPTAAAATLPQRRLEVGRSAVPAQEVRELLGGEFLQISHAVLGE
jgi:hypothetical protein